LIAGRAPATMAAVMTERPDPMSLARTVALSLLTLTAACKVGVDPESGTYACNGPGDCLEGYDCLREPNQDPGSLGVCGKRCGGPGDCDQGETCTSDGLCARSCGDHADCGPAEVCRENACQTGCTGQCGNDSCVINKALPTGTECIRCDLAANSCDAGRVCSTNNAGEGICREPCANDGQCGGDEICAEVLAMAGGSRKVCAYCLGGCPGSDVCRLRRLGPHSFSQVLYCDRGPENNCTDSASNDGDAATDCEDFDCAGDPACSGGTVAESLCNDTLDNDDDSLTDCADPDCGGRNGCETCDDGVNNDNNGPCDCFDGGCAGHPACVTWRKVGLEGVISSVSTGGTNGATRPSVAIANDGIPWVAWTQYEGGTGTAEVRRFDTTSCSWVNPGPTLQSPDGLQNLNDAALAMPKLTTNPGAIWTEQDAANVRNVYYARYDGTSWSGQGSPSSNSGGGVSQIGASLPPREPAFAFDPNGNTPFVMWVQGGNLDGAEFDAGSWSGIPTPQSGTTLPTTGPINLSVAYPPSTSRVFVAWRGNNSGVPAGYVAEFQGGTWVNAGPGSRSGMGATNDGHDVEDLALTVTSGNEPVIAWRSVETQSTIRLRRYNTSNASWGDMAGVADNVDFVYHPAGPFNARNPSMALLPDGTGNDEILVAWEDNETASNAPRIYLQRWQGMTSYGAYAGSLAAQGVTDLPGGGAHRPAVALGPGGNVNRRFCVAFEQSSSGPLQIGVRCANRP
jgi:hypothetical protein